MKLLADIAGYPFRGSGKYLLFFGTALFAISEIIVFAPLVGGIARILLIGFLVATFFTVIETTATGSEEAPYFPEISNVLEDLLWPLLKTFIVSAVSLAPIIAYTLAVPEDGQSTAVSLLLLGWAAFYFPMAMMAVVVLGYLGALSPHIVLPAIFRAGGLYPVVVGIILAVGYFESWCGDFAVDQPLIRIPLTAVVAMLALMWNGRTLGVIYRERREAMGWI